MSRIFLQDLEGSRNIQQCTYRECAKSRVSAYLLHMGMSMSRALVSQTHGTGKAFRGWGSGTWRGLPRVGLGGLVQLSPGEAQQNGSASLCEAQGTGATFHGWGSRGMALLSSGPSANVTRVSTKISAVVSPSGCLCPADCFPTKMVPAKIS